MVNRTVASEMSKSEPFEPNMSPLTPTGRKIMKSMRKTYGSKDKAKEVFNACIKDKKPGSERWEK